MSFTAGVRVMRYVHERGATCRDIEAIEAAIRYFEAEHDIEAAAVAYEWYARFADELGWREAA